jgi:hypothetical protein
MPEEEPDTLPGGGMSEEVKSALGITLSRNTLPGRGIFKPTVSKDASKEFKGDVRREDAPAISSRGVGHEDTTPEGYRVIQCKTNQQGLIDGYRDTQVKANQQGLIDGYRDTQAKASQEDLTDASSQGEPEGTL